MELNGKQYTENFQAENGDDPQSCVTKDGVGGSPIQPGEAVTCDVIFDVPMSSVSALNTNGNLYVTNFGDDISTSTGPLGIFRTYH